MKTLLFFTILSLFTLSNNSLLSAQNVAIPDANFKAYLVGNTAINTNGDTEIQTTEAQSFTGQIDCNTLNIADLTGIEAFTALTSLKCYDNQLTSLDVSSNIALTDLRLFNNQITSLDVSNNLALIQLNCQTNSLTSLDLSANTLLQYLFCFDNQLISLNIANGNNTNIALFFATGNPNLTCIQVDDSTYSTTNWTNIDTTASYSANCSGCVVTIPDANFKTYLVANTAINTNMDTEIQCSEASVFAGTIDCSGLGISDLTGIGAFTSLTELICYNNSLSVIDLSNNIALTILECFINSIGALNLSNNTALTKLNCSNNSINTLDLSTNILLTHLHGGGNPLTSLDLSNNTVLALLSCNNNSSLTSLNVANGNNTNISAFSAIANPNLHCIQVDDTTYSNANWTNIDPGVVFRTSATDCSVINDVSRITGQLPNINAYPNPTTDILSLSLGQHYTNVEVQVSNIMGQVVFSNNYNGVQTLDLELDGATGVYFVKIKTEEGEATIKVVKE